MHNALLRLLFVAGGTTLVLLIVAGLLHLIPRLGPAGRRLSDGLCRAPGLDVLIMFFTVLPLVVGPIVGGWTGLGAAIVGQVAAHPRSPCDPIRSAGRDPPPQRSAPPSLNAMVDPHNC